MSVESKFDWKALFGDKLLNKTTEVDTKDVLEGLDAVVIYFSAHWCPDCKAFTPKFAESYNALKAAGKKFEVVFTSNDNDEAAFTEYYGTMPWLAMPFSEKAKSDALHDKYKCEGIPYLVILDGYDGSVITTKDTGAIVSSTFTELYSFYVLNAVNDVKDSMEGIQTEISLLLIQNYADDAIKTKNSDMLMKFAKENKGLFGRYFTINGGGASVFLTQELDLVNPVEHPHPVEKQIDTSTAYIELYGDKMFAMGWNCESCGKSGRDAKEQHHCKVCQYDLCDVCVLNLNKPIPDEVKEPVLIIYDFPCRKYYMPMNPVVNEDNIKVFAADFKKGELKGTFLKSKRDEDAGN